MHLRSGAEREFGREDVHGGEALAPEGAETQGVVAFGEPAAVLVEHQAAVEPPGRRSAIGPGGPITSIAVSGDRRRLACADTVTGVHLWEAEAPKK